jgi:hypothetical protein
MYIEIDDRQKGKTTRLVENAYNHIINNKVKICICSNTIINSKIIKNKILDNLKKNNPELNCSEYSKLIITSKGMNDSHLFGYNIDKYYVDEFDYMSRSDIKYYPNSYMTTSINEDTSSLIFNEHFFKKFMSDRMTRKWKIEKVLNSDIPLIEFLNKFYNFNIKENILNKIK